MLPATYVAALVRAHLRGITPLLKEERDALERVVAELTAVGRNLMIATSRQPSVFVRDDV